MSIIFVLVPLAVVMLGVALAAFFWAVGHEQFDDLDSPGVRVPRSREAGDSALAISASVMDGPPAAPRRSTRPSTRSSMSGDCCSNSAASSRAFRRTSSAARRVASPVITVAREAKAPMPNSIRSVRPCTTRTRR